jgi:hypothetical protein
MKSMTENVNVTIQKAAPHEELPSVDFFSDKLTRQILQKKERKKKIANTLTLPILFRVDVYDGGASTRSKMCLD